MQRVPVPGSLVWLRQRRWRVDRVRADRRVVRLDVSHRSTHLTVLTPFDRPRQLSDDRRVVRVRRQQGLARLAHLVASAPGAQLAQAAVRSRIDIWPHQIEPALAVADGWRRLLIADDVGLGKTIQAGLILAGIVRRHADARALVITPASLCRQWLGELTARFGLDACTVEEGLTRLTVQQARGANPWLRPGVWIASIDYLKQAHVLAGLPAEPWDVVVIDEAHTVSGRSDRYEACDELGRRARHLVLLTATPHDGNRVRFARLVRLGSLPLVGDELVVFRRTRVDVPLPRHRVIRWMPLAPTPELALLLDTLRAFERVVLTGVRPDTHDAALLFLSVLRKRALSTVAAFDRSLARRLEWLSSFAGAERPGWTQPSLDFGEDDINDEDRTLLAADVGLPRERERAWLTRLRRLATAARRRDPKLACLRRLLERSCEPAVVFTEYRHSLDEVERLLAAIRPVAAIHGGQSDAVRQREIARFLRGEASVLIATDVGSLGLNLQSRARWLINLELPWNPTRLEQRIGRLDRIGQARRVHATMFVIRHAAESPVLSALARKTTTAREAMGASTLADSTPPSPLAMASVLIEGQPMPPADVVPTALPLCRTFVRRARAHAVVAQRRRALLSRWRAAQGPGSRPILTRVSALPHRLVVVVSIPIADGTGEVIERRLAAVHVDNVAQYPDDAHALHAALTMRLVPIAERRLRRLTRLVQAAARRRTATERAIAGHLHNVTHLGEAQLGLFSQRSAKAMDDARARAALTTTITTTRLRMEAARQELSIGVVTIEWIGERR